MRILMTTDTVGGVWTFTQELTEGLLDEGCSVALVSLGRQASHAQGAWADRVRDLFGDRFQFHSSAAPLEWMQNNALAFEAAAALLERLASVFRADVVHANQFCFGALAIHLPVLITAHSDVLSWARACRPQQLPQTEWLDQYRALVQAGLNGAAAVAAPTRWMQEALLEGFQVPKARWVVANGVTFDRVPSSDRQLKAVTAGRLWDEGKNLRILTEIDACMPLVIAGELPAGELPAKLEFTGPLDRDSLLKLFDNSAIYICPSLYEPFGLAPLEAALCGCAVLAKDIASLREVWDDAALYFTGGVDLERQLARLQADPALLCEVQTRCYQRAQGMSRRRMAAAYLGIYSDMLCAREERAHAA